MALVVGGVTVTGTQTLDASKLTGTASAINGSNITNLPAPSAANVGSATAQLTLGQVGTYALAQKYQSGTYAQPGDTLAGSEMRWANANGGNTTDGGGLSGTWRSTGPALNSGNGEQRSVVFYRIS
jgi:hypothetical protein